MCSKKQITHDNHYVPQFYLKLWSNNGNTVRTYNGVVSNEGMPYWHNASIKQIACNKDFYTQVVDGAEDDSFENFLESEHEASSVPVFEKVIEGQKITSEEIEILVSFLAAQYVRTPAWYHWVTDRFSKAFHPTLKDVVQKVEKAYKAGTLPADPSHRLDGTLVNENDMFDIPLKLSLDKENSAIKAETLVSRALYLSSAKHTLLTTANVLHDHNWRIFETPDGVLLPTSDNPVIRLGYSSEETYSLNEGIGKKNANIILPLSPRYMLFTQIGQSKKELDQLDFSLGTYRFLIKIIIENATRYVFAKKEIPEINTLRPRLVDPEYFKELKRTREEWNSMNVGLERSFWHGK